MSWPKPSTAAAAQGESLFDQATQLRRLAESRQRPVPQPKPARHPRPIEASTPSVSTPSVSIPSTEPIGSIRPVTAEKPKPTRRARVIAVTSGKGGVGKSNVAVNLAVQFTKLGKRVVLLDADLGLANADVLCGVDPRKNLANFIARTASLAEATVEAPGGFRLIGGATGLARVADLAESERQRIVDALTVLEREADILIIDTGAGIGPNVLSFTRSADHVLAVTTPEPTAITDVYAVLKVVSRDVTEADPEDRRLSLLVNQARSVTEARVVYERISNVARQFLGETILDAGHVFSDAAVGEAVRQRVPFTMASPKCPASACIARLAQRLEKGVAVRPEQPSFFGRMGRWIK
ncbi:MAG: P-loop NTPase, partial [Planctomycetota bacterium]